MSATVNAESVFPAKAGIQPVNAESVIPAKAGIQPVNAESVFPAKAGIQSFAQQNQTLGSRLRGNDQCPAQ
jgi:hypothetical protein